MTGAADALQQGGDRARRGELAHQIHLADVDPELQRCGGNQCAQLAALQARFRVQPRLLCHAAVVRGDVLLAEALGQMPRDALGLPPGVDEYQRSAVLAHELRQTVIELRPDFPGHHRFERRGGNLQLQVALAHVPRVDDGAVGCAIGAQSACADEESGHVRDGLLRRGQAHARERPAGERLEPLERERQMHAALGSDHGMNLIHDHRTGAREHAPAGLGTEQDVQRLRRGDHDVGRALGAGRALVPGRVAGAHESADVDVRQTQRAQLRADAGERRLEVAVDVVGERLERRDIHHPRLVRQEPRGCDTGAHQFIDHREECGECLARTRRGCDQHVTLRCDRRPGRALRGRGRSECAREPLGDGRVERSGHDAIEAQPERPEELRSAWIHTPYSR